MSLTPGKDNVVHNLHGTIYDPVIDGNFIYHMHAAISPEAKKANPVWTIWRENTVTKQIVPPEVAGAPSPDNNIGTDPTALTYWTTA